MGRGVSAETRRIVARAVELWEEVYRPADIVPTVRQLFYALAVEEFVEKSEKGYDIVQRTLARSRERGEYPWDGIYDGLRQVRNPQVWPDLDAFVSTVRRAYRRDKWAGQPRRVEVWIEKDAVRGTVEAVTQELEVPLLVDRGYLSITAKFEASLRIGSHPRTIIYIGDHDPSGVNMLAEAEVWIRAMAEVGDLLVERIAVTDDDRDDPSLPRLPVNARDPRAPEYQRRYGDEVVEVEAIPPEGLQRRLRAAIERHRDESAWEDALEVEAEDQDTLEQVLATASTEG